MTQWPVLAGLSAPERAEVLRTGRLRRFAKGEVIFHHGDPADSLHLLDQGRVAVRVLPPQGEQAILNVLGPGAVFGELALIDGHAHRTATVTAMEACVTMCYGAGNSRDCGNCIPRSTRCCWPPSQPRLTGCPSTSSMCCSRRHRAGSLETGPTAATLCGVGATSRPLTANDRRRADIVGGTRHDDGYI